MTLGPYRDVLRIPQVRHALLFGILLRTPLAASLIVLTLHVVTHLGLSYGRAGLVSMATTLALAVSGPWRGRLVDRQGLRRTFAPSLVVLAVVWSIAPFLPYWPLVLAVVLAGLFQVPVWGVLRQMILHAVPERQRRSALSLDSVATEVSFMIGPAAGVVAASAFDTRYVLLVLMWCSILGAAAMWLLDPALVSELEEAVPGDAPVLEDAGAPGHVGRSEWFSGAAMAVLAVTAAATVILAGSDVSVVALLRSVGEEQGVAVAMAVWAFGSLVGGMLYGMWHRSIPAHVLLAALAVATLPVALTSSTLVTSLALLVAGFFCAPTITATTEQLSRLVPERARGEAMGWHGSAITGGSAIGAPLAGFAIDHLGAPAGFVAVSVAGLLVAAAALTVLARRRRRRAALTLAA